MQIASLDAALSVNAANAALASVSQAAPGTFDALLAGLSAAVSATPDELPTAVPAAFLPPTGKSLPDSSDPVAVGVTAAGSLTEDPFASAASDLLPSDAGDQPAAPDINVIPLALTAPEAISLVTVALPVLPAGDVPVASPGNPPPVVRAASHILPRQKIAELAPTDVSTTASSDQVADGQPLHPQVALAKPVVSVGSEPSASPPQPTPPPPEAPKPAQPLLRSLAILPISAQPLVADAVSPSPRRGHETKLTKLSLTTALSVTSELSPSAAFAMPAPVGAIVGNIATDAITSTAQPHTQSAPQPIALPDHRALVDALVRARAERDPGVSVALETREFGAVALRFETLQSITGERGLQVALSSSDPEFDRAVSSAAAAQAALPDLSSRNPPHRADPAPARSSDQSADASGGRTSQSDPQAQHRGGSESSWREHSASVPSHSDDHPIAPRPDRQRGSIFA